MKTINTLSIAVSFFRTSFLFDSKRPRKFCFLFARVWRILVFRKFVSVLLKINTEKLNPKLLSESGICELKNMWKSICALKASAPFVVFSKFDRSQNAHLFLTGQCLPKGPFQFHSVTSWEDFPGQMLTLDPFRRISWKHGTVPNGLKPVYFSALVLERTVIQAWRDLCFTPHGCHPFRQPSTK